MITASDGGVTLKLAPHVVYRRTKKDVVTVDAVLMERNGQPVNKDSLRTYRVDDLSDIAIGNEGFAVLVGFDPDEPEYSGRTICVVQTV